MARTALPSWLGPFAVRPRLVAAAAAGLAVALASRWLWGLQPVTAAILGWNVLSLSYTGAVLLSFAGQSPAQMRRRAAQEDEGRVVILAVVLAAAVAAIVAVALELTLARSVHGPARGLHIGLAFLTVAASWFMVQLVFALHYAHGYYDQAAAGEGDARGLDFPGGEEPDYWDFLHFAVIVGVAAQTADVAIEAKALRRLNTVHALFAFAFNTVIVALTINLLAGVFG